MTRVDSIDAARLDRLRPLWLQLHAHHQEIAPELGPYVDAADSWAARHARYREVLARGGVAFVLRDDDHGRGRGQDQDLGYAVASRQRAHWFATFAGPDHVAELETLVVRRESRRRGFGGRLLATVHDWAAAAGLAEVCLGVLPQNRDAVAFYRRAGYVPTWLVQTRFGRGSPLPPAADASAIARVAASEVGDLGALWRSLHRHHQNVAPALGPFVDEEQSWEAVWKILAAAVDDGLVLRAGPAAAPWGFACVTTSDDPTLWGDTWRVGAAVAELAILAVAPEHRGAGIGSALMDAVDAHLGRSGIVDQVVGAIAPNARAIDLYRRRGFLPAWLQMRRLAPADGRAG